MPPLLRGTGLLIFTLACSSGGTPDTAPEPDPDDQPTVRIENRASLDMDIYAIRSDRPQPIRLGFAPGGETTVFRLPATVTAGASSIRFEARPVRRSGQSVVSELFGIHVGEITWSVPPQ